MADDLRDVAGRRKHREPTIRRPEAVELMMAWSSTW